MFNKITLEELVLLRDELNRMIAQEDSTMIFSGRRDAIIDYSSAIKKKEAIGRIQNMIQNSEIITTRNYDRIAVGTAFYGRFLKDDEGKFGDIHRYIVVSSNYYSEDNDEFLSIDSPLGQAVLNRKDNEVVTYHVLDENKKEQSIVFYIDQIDRNHENYVSEQRVK